MTSKTLAIAVSVIVIVIVIAGIALWMHGRGGGGKCLVVGTSPDFPPFEYVAKNGSIVGFDIELIKLMAEKAGYKCVEIKSMSFDSLIPALEQGQIDVIAAGMTITPERAQRVDFTNPYWEVDQAILVRADSKFKPKSVEDLSGHLVGVQTGTTAADYLKRANKEKGLNIKIKEYDSYVLAVQDLINGRIDAVMVDLPVAKMFTKQYEGKLVISATVKTGEKYGFAVRKGNKDLLEKLNRALEEIKNSPTWDELVKKYFGSEKLPYT
jgi:polar amino acid transport system substrate-binding protein